jgi:hypothetical protein
LYHYDAVRSAYKKRFTDVRRDEKMMLVCGSADDAAAAAAAASPISSASSAAAAAESDSRAVAGGLAVAGGGAVHVQRCSTHSLKANGFKPLPLNINPGFKMCLSNSACATTRRGHCAVLRGHQARPGAHLPLPQVAQDGARRQVRRRGQRAADRTGGGRLVALTPLPGGVRLATWTY